MATSYLKTHPEEICPGAEGALGLRFGVPIDALRYLAREFGGGKKAPKDVVIEPAPPGHPLRRHRRRDGHDPARRRWCSTSRSSTSRPTRSGSARGSRSMSLKVLGDVESPLAGLIKSGALDLSKPGNLVAFMPKRPAALVDAKDDRIVARPR